MAALTHPSLDPTLARYAAPELLACGARAAAFRARAVDTGAGVVVRVLHPELNPPPDRFLQTLRMAAHLRHPGLVPILDFGHVDGRGFWVTPYYEAGSLRRRLESAGPVTAEAAARWLGQVRQALDYLHRRGLAHAGLSTRRLFLAPDPQWPDDGRLLLDGAGLAPLWTPPDAPAASFADDIRALAALTAGLGAETLTGRRDEAAPDVNDAGPLPAAALEDTGPAPAATPDWVDVITPGQRAQAFPLMPGETTIGRDPDNDLVFNQAEVSRRHVRIMAADGRRTVIDLGSANGTFLDGARLPPHTPHDWPPGVPLQIGVNVLLYRSRAGPTTRQDREPEAAVPARATASRRRYPALAAPSVQTAAARHGAPAPRTLTVLSSLGLVVGALVMAVAWPEMAGLIAPADQRAQAAQTATALWFGADDDRDGLPNALEMTYGSLPLVPDSDGDGLTDGNEVRRGLDPIRPDSDGDRTPDPMDLPVALTPTAPPGVTPTTGAVALAGLEPGSVVAGEGAFKLRVMGGGFTTEAVVQWNGQDRPTQFIDARTLIASIPAEDVAAAGTAEVRVRVPGAAEAEPLKFAVYNPAPVIYPGGLEPVAVEAGGPAFTLVVNGASFADGAVVRWNGMDRPTLYRGPAQLAAFITAGDIAQPGTASVAVFNPRPGGGLSASQAVVVETATPALTGLSPSVGVAGGPALTVTVTGAHFQSGAVVRWNGADRPTTWVSGAQLAVNLPASDLAAAGSATITVANPGTGAASNALRFSIHNPAPALAAVSPVTATAGSPGVVLTVSGANFMPGAAVLWNGAPRPTTWISATQLMAAVPAADLSSPGPVVIGVVNNPPGGGPSQTTATLTVAGP